MINTKITIGITCYREGPLLERAWESVLDQSDPNWRVIMVLDGNADCITEKIFNKLNNPHLLKYKAKINRGPYASRIKAIELTQTEWFYYLDADDTLPVDAIKNFYDNVQDESYYYCGDCQLIFPDGRKMIQSRPFTNANDLILNTQHPSIVAWKRDFFYELEGYVSELNWGRADFEFALHAFELMAPYTYVNKNVYNYHLRKNSVHHAINSNMGYQYQLIWQRRKLLFENPVTKAKFLFTGYNLSVEYHLSHCNYFLAELYRRRLLRNTRESLNLKNQLFFSMPLILIKLFFPLKRLYRDIAKLKSRK